MLRAKNTLKKIKFDRERFVKDFNDAVIGLVYDAARAWLDAVLHSVDGTFPVYTGMAIHSLKPLHTHLKQGPGEDPTVPVSFTIVATVKGKTPSMGVAAGRDFAIRVSKNQYGVNKVEFDWSSHVPHYQYNEYNSPPKNFKLIHPGPWHTLEAGQRAFESYIEAHVRERIDGALRSYEYLYEEG